MSYSIDRINSFHPIENLDLYKVREVMTSSEISRTEKIQFIKKNHNEIKNLAKEKISCSDFKSIMDKRPLKLFKPIKNAYTKAGDKKILAIALGIKPSEVNNYIENVTQEINKTSDLNKAGITKDNYEKIKTYVYRHGTKGQVINILDFELSHTKNIVTMLYETLDYHSCGVANYFLRPIHRFDNNTLINIYNIIDRNLRQSFHSGMISETKSLETSEWALARIYEIQNNQRLLNAIKLKKTLE